MDNVDYITMCCHWQKNGFPYFGLFWLMCLFRMSLNEQYSDEEQRSSKHENCRHINLIITILANFRTCIWPQLTVIYICPITHDNCTCIFHDLSKLFSSVHELYRFRRELPCFYPGKVTVTIIRSKRGGMFKMLLWDFWQRMGHELINIHLGTDDSPCVVRPCSNPLQNLSF